MASTPRLPQHPARHTTELYPLRFPRCFITSMGWLPFSTSTLTPRLISRCLRSCVFCISFWMKSLEAMAACWHSNAASAASSASPVSMAVFAFSDASAAAAAAFAAALATAIATALSPWRSRRRDGFLPSAFQNSSTSTPGGRLGSSFVSGRSLRSWASNTKTRSTPAGRDLPSVASHFSPFSLAWIEGSSTGPFPALGNVATHASTCSYQGIIGFLPRLSCASSSSNSMLKNSSTSELNSSTSSAVSVAQIDSGGGAISYMPKSR
mmetsp:Transcript_58068/g.123166  ORF Transcript_58068/g.123166 Transcript_58068/m.123166 type:complete len:266 (+) Transcript_58068:501-1298(+)